VNIDSKLAFEIVRVLFAAMVIFGRGPADQTVFWHVGLEVRSWRGSLGAILGFVLSIQLADPGGAFIVNTLLSVS